MPELPEVETVRRTLAQNILGHVILGVKVRRESVICGSAKPKALLNGLRIEKLVRHGKQLAIVGTTKKSTAGDKSSIERCICVHLGMTGSLRFASGGGKLKDPHCHVVWKLDGQAQLRFRDPRRFGGIWTFDSLSALQDQRWNRLGPDALLIKPKQLHQKLLGTRRAIKAALLDQQLIAGLGNIYVDELLFTCRLNPLQAANSLSIEQVRPLVTKMKRLLNRAIDTGGSSLRDYVDSDGRPGKFQQLHQVYGREALPCRNCGQPLSKTIVGGRTTVCCEQCQPLKVS
jgi:formamidopyrimidine-DNA glycosylase